MTVNSVLGLRGINYPPNGETGLKNESDNFRGHNMSRQLSTENGKLKEVIKDRNECAWKYDGVCCNDRSIYIADYPGEHCTTCKLFMRERK